MGSWKEGGVLGEEKWEGEALVALEELGPWRRSLLPEVGKMTPRVNWLPQGVLGDGLRVACMLGRFRGVLL